MAQRAEVKERGEDGQGLLSLDHCNTRMACGACHGELTA